MELTGQQFGQLRVLRQLDGKKQWVCCCSCGTEVVVKESKLLNGSAKSCGCLKKQLRGTDITGQRSGKLVALCPTAQKRRGATLWKCRCDCGKEVLTEAYKIRNQKILSCGCTRTEKKIKDITGQRFGKLVALHRLEEKRGSNYYWLCQCDCGKQTRITANALLSGNTKSCGCGRVQAVLKTNEKYGTVADHVSLIDGTCVEKIARTGLQKNNTSGYTGVQARGNKWIAIITFKKKVYYLGTYTRLEDAVQVRKKAENLLFGEFLDWYYENYPKKERAGGTETDSAALTE